MVIQSNAGAPRWIESQLTWYLELDTAVLKRIERSTQLFSWNSRCNNISVGVFGLLLVILTARCFCVNELYFFKPVLLLYKKLNNHKFNGIVIIHKKTEIRQWNIKNIIVCMAASISTKRWAEYRSYEMLFLWIIIFLIVNWCTTVIPTSITEIISSKQINCCISLKSICSVLLLECCSDAVEQS